MTKTSKKCTQKPSKPYKHVGLVEVHLWGQHIGSVALDPTYDVYSFAYTDEFAKLGIEPAPLQMPAVAQAPYVFSDLPVATYKRLPAMLRDALPDDFGNALIDQYFADQGIAATEVTALDAFYPAEEYHHDYYRTNALRYRFYRAACGRDARLDQLWGDYLQS